MKVLFVLLHPFGSDNKAVEVIPDEVIDENPCDFVVKPLFTLFIDIHQIIMGLNEQSDGFFVDIAVKFILDHVLVKVEPFQGAN